ncbi:MAG: hypothetical protein LBS27_10625 [Bifidobacteriaceae bacterium]|nr:hypothetical protein [Bifidobacteriaceae bacterium]
MLDWNSAAIRARDGHAHVGAGDGIVRLVEDYPRLALLHDDRDFDLIARHVPELKIA